MSRRARFAGWVAKDNSYVIAAAGKNAYEVGTRWGPCLHSNMAAELDLSGAYLPFESRIYILPVDMDMLLRMYKDDFADHKILGCSFRRTLMALHSGRTPCQLRR
jgi:hypothetical protein